MDDPLEMQHTLDRMLAGRLKLAIEHLCGEEGKGITMHFWKKGFSYEMVSV